MRSARIKIALIAPALLLPLALAACDKGPSVSATNATQAEVKEKVAAATAAGGGAMIEPGRWEGAMTIHDMDMPNVPPEAKAQMKAGLGKPRTFISCVTPEDVKGQKAFFTGGDEADKSCKYDHFTMSGGKIDAAMACDHGGGAKMAMTMNGSYSADNYQMNMTSKSEGGGAMGAMSVKMSVEAKRVGACTGGKDEN